jgi:hypothetical protein
MAGQIAPLKVAIVAVAEVTVSTLFDMFDLSSSPGRDFSFITRGTPGAQLMTPYIVGRTRGRLEASQ